MNGFGRALVATLFLVASADATYIGVTPKKLAVVEKPGAAKVAYAVSDKVDGITKGPGTDVGAISAFVQLRYANGGALGSFTLPAGAFDGTSGWVTNTDTVAKYLNKASPNGVAAKSALVKPGSQLKLSAKGLGDVPFDVLAGGDPAGSVFVAFCVTNEGVNCHCSELNACAYKPSGGGSGATLKCKGGLPDPTCQALPVLPSPIARPADPVVLTGAQVGLLGIAPQNLVAFRWVNFWQQIPVQVDERAVISFDQVYNNMGGGSFCSGTCGGGYTRLDYTDTGTFTGADPDPTLDADDEVALMAADAGIQAAFGINQPPHTVPGSGVQITVTDPIGPGPGYVYLFQQDGSLDPSAGQQYVAYFFNLLSGAYLTTYQLITGPNPENTTVDTNTYIRHFGDRWLTDQLQLLAGPSTGVDILDRNKLSAFGCSRTEDTFDASEGAFVSNHGGPVRAIRSYLGANSGPRTQRQHVFYRAREDVTTFLRVHAIPGPVHDFIDYSGNAIGMKYYDNGNTSGVTIDGMPDTVTAGALQWQLVTGPQGSVTHVGQFSTNISGFTATATYEDDAMATDQCSGSPAAYGASGVQIQDGTGNVPSTDPVLGATAFLTATRITYYDGPGLVVADAQKRYDWVFNPLVTSTAPWP